MRCTTILGDGGIINLVAESGSPSAAYDMVLAETGDASKAKAGRWLAVLRRDYPTDYNELISTNPSHVDTDTAKKGL